MNIEGMKDFMKGVFKPVDTKELDEKGQPKPDMSEQELTEANANLTQTREEEAMKEREALAQKAIEEQELQAKEDQSKTSEQIADELKSAGLDIKFKSKE